MTRPREEWRADVTARYRALEQFSKEDARLQFLRILRSLPYGNSIFFAVKRIEDPIGLLPAKLILGINKRGVHFFRCAAAERALRGAAAWARPASPLARASGGDGTGSRSCVPPSPLPAPTHRALAQTRVHVNAHADVHLAIHRQRPIHMPTSASH